MEKFVDNLYNKLIYGNETRFNYIKTLEELENEISKIISNKSLDFVIKKTDDDKINSLIVKLGQYFNMNDNPDCFFELSIIQGLRLYYWRRLFNQEDLLKNKFNKLSNEYEEKRNNLPQVKYMAYYQEYDMIYLEKKFSEDERGFINSHEGLHIQNNKENITREGAFWILVNRKQYEKDNMHLRVNNINSFQDIKLLHSKFYDAYKHRNKNKTLPKER